MISIQKAIEEVREMGFTPNVSENDHGFRSIEVNGVYLDFFKGSSELEDFEVFMTSILFSRELL